MTREQIEAIARTREIDPLVEIRSLADGFILERAVSLGQAFQPTTRLYTIVDLSLVWILADAFETDEHFLRPGTRATISHPALEGDLEGVVSDVLPCFDPGTRTPVGLKILCTDAARIEELGVEIESLLRTVPGACSVYAERTAGAAVAAA